MKIKMLKEIVNNFDDEQEIQLISSSGLQYTIDPIKLATLLIASQDKDYDKTSIVKLRIK